MNLSSPGEPPSSILCLSACDPSVSSTGREMTGTRNGTTSTLVPVAHVFDCVRSLDTVWVCVRNKQWELWMCAVLQMYFFYTLKDVKWPSEEQDSTLTITPLPATQLDRGQCAKHLWKRPPAFSLTECPLRNVFPTLPIFIRSIEIPTHFCHVRLVRLQVWHDGAHLD